MLQTGLFEKVALINLSSRDATGAWRSSIGLLFIDGDHPLPAVKGDVGAWDPHVSIGGVVAFDDAVDPEIGPAKTIKQLIDSGRYVHLESVGKIAFLRKINNNGSFHRIDKERIIVAIHELIVAGGLFRFDRFGRIS
jgi:hypothetical protein